MVMANVAIDFEIMKDKASVKSKLWWRLRLFERLRIW